MELVPVGYRDHITMYGGNGLQWVDGETIGRLLYPHQKDFSRAVRKVYDRNKRHFTEKDTVLLKSDTSYNWASSEGDMKGQSDPACPPKNFVRKQDVRFFSVPDGLMKICHFSRSNNALPVQQRILDMWKAFITGTLPKPQPTLLAVSRRPLWDRGRGADIKRLAAEEGVTEMTIRRRIRKAEAGEPLQKTRSSYVSRKYRDVYNEAMKLRKKGISVLKIAQKLNIPHQTLYHWFKKPQLN